MEMLRAGEVREDDDSYQSPLDELFERLEMRSPDHIAVKYYKDYRSGSAKTLKSIQITLAARLEKFNLSSVAALTATDELDLASLGEKKVALFALIPDNDSSFNFLVSLLYASTFQELFYSADRVHGGSLPVPVHFLMDEFANVSLPDDFDKLLATMRSRNISVSIIIQNIAQLKALYEKQWESIMGNCDEFLYLGGNETSTHKLISENYLGKSTLWLDTYGKSTGHSGSYSTNNQITGRELLTPDEVRMLDNNLALLFIRGEPPLMDEKYDLLKHPNVKYTTDGGAPVYSHGGTENAVADMTIPESKYTLIAEAEKRVAKIDKQFKLDLWTGLSHQCSCIWLFPHQLMLPPVTPKMAQKRSERMAKRLVKSILAGEKSKKAPPKMGLNGLESKVWPKLAVGKAKKFAVTDACIGCHQCEKLCPKGNIRFVDGKPTFGTNCIQCLSCLQYCPKEAITLTEKSVKREHYHNPNVSAAELMESIIHID